MLADRCSYGVNTSRLYNLRIVSLYRNPHHLPHALSPYLSPAHTASKHAGMQAGNFRSVSETPSSSSAGIGTTHRWLNCSIIKASLKIIGFSDKADQESIRSNFMTLHLQPCVDRREILLACWLASWVSGCCLARCLLVSAYALYRLSVITPLCEW